jgi:hypothetical protein
MSAQQQKNIVEMNKQLDELHKLDFGNTKIASAINNNNELELQIDGKQILIYFDNGKIHSIVEKGTNVPNPENYENLVAIFDGVASMGTLLPKPTQNVGSFKHDFWNSSKTDESQINPMFTKITETPINPMFTKITETPINPMFTKITETPINPMFTKITETPTFQCKTPEIQTRISESQPIPFKAPETFQFGIMGPNGFLPLGPVNTDDLIKFFGTSLNLQPIQKMNQKIIQEQQKNQRGNFRTGTMGPGNQAPRMNNPNHQQQNNFRAGPPNQQQQNNFRAGLPPNQQQQQQNNFRAGPPNNQENNFHGQHQPSMKQNNFHGGQNLYQTNGKY